jgi:hypothetical protein
VQNLNCPFTAIDLKKCGADKVGICEFEVKFRFIGKLLGPLTANKCHAFIPQPLGQVFVQNTGCNFRVAEGPAASTDFCCAIADVGRDAKEWINPLFANVVTNFGDVRSC